MENIFQGLKIFQEGMEIVKIFRGMFNNFTGRIGGYENISWEEGTAP
jgi:hypothetical protein